MPETLYIDQREYPAQPDRNLLEVCLSLGFDLPYFCWHPALGSVGACRQCAVKQFRDENDDSGRIVMACMTAAKPGTRVSVSDPQARAFRASVIEWLMTNHPHDCPVCDEGGECHLQDMTVMTGHTYRRYRGTKRTFRNQDLGPFVDHEMNRCIACYRCVRFYSDYAGGTDLQALASKNHVYFGRQADGTLESPFSGNLVEVCPTGVFTDRTLKAHFARKWDLQSAPSLCVHCSLGCNTLVSERAGSLRRVLNRYNHDVNGYFLCDRGRYGYGFVNDEQRLREPRMRDRAIPAPHREPRYAALSRVADLLADRDSVVGIGSPRASLEANFALRELVGADRFVLGVSDLDAQLDATIARLLRDSPAHTPTLPEIESCDAVLVLGEDVLATAPRLALALRQSVRNRAFDVAAKASVPRWDDGGVRAAAQDERSPLFLATTGATGLDDIASDCWRAAPDALARFGFAIAHAVDATAPAVAGLQPAVLERVQRVARALQAAQRPLVVSGSGCRSLPLLHAAANIGLALHRTGKPASLRLVAGECNSIGLALLGGQPLSAAFARVREGQARTVLVLENDLYRRAPSRAVDALLDAAHVIVLDHTLHATAQRAAVCLPAATFAEGSGTLVSSEGRAQRFLRAMAPAAAVRDSWYWLGEIASALSSRSPNPWPTLDAATRACAQAHPLLARIVDAAPDAAFRANGRRIARQPLRYSGRTALTADVSVHEPKPPADADTPLAFSMEGYTGAPPPGLLTHFWSPGWNSCQAVNKFQSEVPGPLRGGPAGVRLDHADAHQPHDYFADIPAPSRAPAQDLLLLPRPLVFGSDELSMRAPAVRERAGRACVLLAPADAQRLRIEANALATIATADGCCQLPVAIDAAVPPGTAAVPVGLPGLPWLGLPAWGAVSPIEAHAEETAR